ncbi:hypothetical protein PS9374_04650 [Planomonospora sphaerica]|uniref:Lipoprotein n=1 Tax=Planomonospora sphaerica TaxID=161355 RepID=A0A161LN53_9ACTN|nr:hypothetical protein [Planomonospora sphaerica]GAT68985.1 hypothetical protein PS9374_04650 [Planomonospora sphaerica]
MRTLAVLLAATLALGLTGCTTARRLLEQAASTTSPPPTPAPLATTPKETSTEEPRQPRPHRTTTEHYKGTGDKLIFITPTSDVGIATVVARGKGTFIVRTVDASGDDAEYLAEGEGDHQGTRFFNLQADDEDTIALRVTAQGSWTITLDPPSSARIWRGPQVAGVGDAVLEMDQRAEGNEKITSVFNGESNFTVEGASEDGAALLANEIGTCKVEEVVPDGTFLVIVRGDGPWRLQRSGPEPMLTAADLHPRDDRLTL